MEVETSGAYQVSGDSQHTDLRMALDHLFLTYPNLTDELAVQIVATDVITAEPQKNQQYRILAGKPVNTGM